MMIGTKISLRVIIRVGFRDMMGVKVREEPCHL